MPSTPYDAKGLLKTALREPNPVIFFEDKVMYAKVKGPVPEEEYCIPFGQADIKRAGKDVTLIAISRMIHPALAAAEKLAAEGIERRGGRPAHADPAGRSDPDRIRGEDRRGGDRR